MPILEIRTKLRHRDAGATPPITGRLTLAFDQRQKTRFLATLDAGGDVAVMLPRGEILRGGDLVAAADGAIVEIVAAIEPTVRIQAESPTLLARAAYHLGNRHVPVEIGEGYLRIAPDHVLEDMLRKLGLALASEPSAFEPEGGAYAAGHSHGPDSSGAKIHEYGAPHDHEPLHHRHDHSHAGDHSHHHPQAGG